MIKGIKFASIPVADQDRALAFYTEKLGFRILTDSPFNDDQRWIELGIPNAETKVVLFTPDAHKDRVGTFGHITFWTDNVQKTYDELKAKGVEFEGEPATAEWGSHAIFKDSEGNPFVLSSK
ncbi:MAG TPA: VOC family protein [Longimicrobiales bacterium]|nr:VOC family protein [Longimicrobiales bacterium]